MGATMLAKAIIGVGLLGVAYIYLGPTQEPQGKHAVIKCTVEGVDRNPLTPPQIIQGECERRFMTPR